MEIVKQAQTLHTLHNFTTHCLKEDLQPIVLLSLSVKNNEATIAANISDGVPPEEVIKILEGALLGIKQQLNTTPSGIIKSVANG